MDKYEYKIRADEIKDLIARREFAQAAEIADTIDWRRVKSVMMLCTISDVYKKNRRYEDARNMLLLAYERRPGGRTICYSLCELSIKMEDFVPAVNYYKEFVQVAPKDPGRYILQYKLYEAQDVSLEERIGVLEELKKRDYREKWAYELAYLYHRVGLATRCVEECDELILWFGEGKYVIKAMELKMLHQQLTPSQQERYDHRFDGYGQSYYEPAQEEVPRKQPYYGAGQEAAFQEQLYYAPEQERPVYEAGGKTRIYETVPREQGTFPEQGQFSAQEPYMGQEFPPGTMDQGQGAFMGQEIPLEQELFVGEEYPMGEEFPLGGEYPMGQEQPLTPAGDAMPRRTEELDIQVKTMDMGQYNTINLQAEIAAGLKEVLEENTATREDEITKAIMAPMMETESLDLPEIDEVDENDPGPEAEVMEGSEVFFGETGELGDVQTVGQMAPGEIVPEISSVMRKTAPAGEVVTETPVKREPVEISVRRREPVETPVEEKAARKEAGEKQPRTDATAETVMEQLKWESKAEAQALTAQPPKEIAGVLSQESDGQISFVLPEREQIEKQITGQMNLDDILKEWERMKQESAERRREDVRQHVLRHTGEMFTAFEASVRDGLLEQLEGGTQEPAEETAPDGIVEESLSGEAAGEASAEEPEEEPIGDNEDWDSEPLEEPEAVSEELPEETEDGEEEPPEEKKPVLEEIPEEQRAALKAMLEKMLEDAEADLEGMLEEAESQAALEEMLAEAESVAMPETGLGKAEPEAILRAADGVEADGEAQEPEKQEPPARKTEEPARAEGEKPSTEREKSKVRTLTKEEKELYAPFIQSRASREQIVQAIDNISMAAYTGNIVITGEEGMDTVSLAKNMIREVQMTDSNFAGKVAKISGQALNKKDVDATLNQLASGALIIQKAAALDEETAQRLHKALQQEAFGIIVVLEDAKKAMNKFLEKYPKLAACFTARVDVEALSNGTLVAFGRKYAREKEYSIDDMGILALHTRIDEMQTIDHAVTVLEVKELVDNAIRRANRKTLKHFFDVLLAKRYDEEDMIILSEKDFVKE